VGGEGRDLDRRGWMGWILCEALSACGLVGLLGHYTGGYQLLGHYIEGYQLLGHYTGGYQLLAVHAVISSPRFKI
jgi:hypothetical protein